MAAPFDPYHRWLGIPPAEQPANHYRLLGLALFESDPEVISEGADRQMSFVRTNQTGPHAAESQKLLNELAAARMTLLNAGNKAAYDAQLRTRLAPAPPPVPAPPPPPVASGAAPTVVAPPPVAASNAASPAGAAGATRVVEAKVRRPAGETDAPAAEVATAKQKLSPVVLGGIGVGAAVLVLAIVWLTLPRGDDADGDDRVAAVEPTSAESTPGGLEFPDLVERAASVGTAEPATTETTTAEPTPGDEPTPVAPPTERPETPESMKPEMRPPGENPAPPPDEPAPAPAPETPETTVPGDAPAGDFVWPRSIVFEPRRWTAPDVEQSLVPVTEGLALLTGANGTFHGAGDSLWVRRVNDVWTGGGAAEAATMAGDFSVLRFPTAGLRFREYTWERGQPPLEMISADEGFCVLSSVAGPFYTADAWSRLDIGDDRKWRLVVGSADRRKKITVMAVIVPGWKGRVTFKRWTMGQSPVDLLPANQGFCYLAGFGGVGGEQTDRVRVGLNNNRWTLAGNSSVSDGQAWAAVVRIDSAIQSGLVAAAAPVDRPGDDDLAAARKELQTELAKPLAEARTTAAKIALAKSLRSRGQDKEAPPATRFARLERSAQLASDGRDPELAWQIWDELAATFAVDAVSGKADALTDAAALVKSPDAASQMADKWLELVDEAVAREDYPQAEKCVEKADVWARKSNSEAARQIALKKRAAVRSLKTAFAAAQPARDRLATDENDASAAGAWGRYLCAYKEDFDRGLCLLARGEDAWSELARREEEFPSAAADRLKLADDWWTAADRETDAAAKKAARRRAAHHYRDALSGLSAAEKRHAEERLAAVEAEFPRFPVGEWHDALTLADPEVHGFRGRWSRRGKAVVAEERASSLAIPVIPEGSYDFRVKFVRTFGADGLTIGLPVGRDGAVRVLLGYDGGTEQMILDARADSLKGDRTRVQVGRLVTGQEHTAVVRTLVDGERASVDVALDGVPILHWDGLVSALVPPRGTGQDPRCVRLELSPETIAAITGAEICVRSGAARLAVN